MACPASTRRGPREGLEQGWKNRDQSRGTAWRVILQPILVTIPPKTAAKNLKPLQKSMSPPLLSIVEPGSGCGNLAGIICDITTDRADGAWRGGFSESFAFGCACSKRACLLPALGFLLPAHRLSSGSILLVGRRAPQTGTARLAIGSVKGKGDSPSYHQLSTWSGWSHSAGRPAALFQRLVGAVPMVSDPMS